jgi:hypothetical protein
MMKADDGVSHIPNGIWHNGLMCKWDHTVEVNKIVRILSRIHWHLLNRSAIILI